MNVLTVQQKAEQGMELTISELAQVSGYGRVTLHLMAKQEGLVLIHGKISLPEFRRHLRRRRSAMEDALTNPAPISDEDREARAAAMKLWDDSPKSGRRKRG